MSVKRSCFILYHYSILLCFFMISHSESMAQTRKLKIEHVSDLSHNFVNCILQDSYGLIWVGTKDGLSKYDGYHFTIYKYEFSDKNSANYEVTALLEDPDGTFWVGSRYGLYKFDPNTGIFTKCNQYTENKQDKKDRRVRDLLLDRSGFLWVVTKRGLNRFDPVTGSLVRFNHDTDNSKSLNSDDFNTILEDASGRVWVGTKNGLYRFNPDTGDFTSFKNEPNNPNSLSHNWIEHLLEDASGTLWVTTHNGLNKFDYKTETFLQYLFIDPIEIRNKGSLARKVVEDSSGDLWVVNNDKLVRFDTKAGTFDAYTITNTYLLKNSILFIDQSGGALWLGTGGWGLHKANINIYKFKHYLHEADNPNSLSYPSVRGFYEDEAGILWVGGYGGLNRIDRDIGTFSNYTITNSNIEGDAVFSIYANPERDGNNLWLGIEGGGLNKFNRVTGEVQVFLHDLEDPKSISDNFVRAIKEDKDGVLWIGTGNGLNRMDRESEIFKHYLSGKRIVEIIEDQLGFLWIGTDGNGLYRFNRTTEQFKVFKRDAQDATSLNNNKIKSIYEDSSGHIWIGTNGGGLNRFDRETETFTHYKETDGLPDNLVYGILEDGLGRLWLSTNNGLSCFNPELKFFRNYHEQDGLQGREYNMGSFYKSSQGELFFGGLNGFNAFFGERIVGDLIVPPVVFTGMKKLNEQFVPERRIHGMEDKIILTHKDRVVFFEFSILDYVSSEKHQYAYKLEGVNDQWVDLDNNREVTLMNLNPGSYTLRVKGANSIGTWNEVGASVQIKVLPPWWKTWWATLFYVCIFILFLIGFIEFRTARLIKNKKELEQTVEERTAKVVSTLNKLKTAQEQLVESEKMAALGVLTAGIAHEINNPINFISSGAHSLDMDFKDLLHILNKLKALPQDGEALKERAEIIRKLEEEYAFDDLIKYIPQTIADIKEGVKRTNEITKGLLLYSRSNTLKRQATNIHENIDASLVLLRDKYKHRIKITKQYDHTIGKIECFSGQLSQVFTNFIDNAIDAIEDKGTITITTKLKNKHVEISIRDSGEGISDKNLSKIFDPFFTTKEVGKGTGLGLSICQGIINNHDGKIKVKSELIKGSEFVVTLPSNHK